MTGVRHGCAMQAPGVVARTIAGETLLVPVERGIADCDTVFILNPTGAFLWERLDGTRSAEALASEVEGEFDVPTMDAAFTDVRSFLAALHQRQLVTWEASG